MSARTRLGLRGQLLIIAVIAMAPSFGVLGWHFLSAWDHAVETAQLRSKVVADGVARDLWGIFRDYRETVGELVRRPQIRALDPARCDPILQEYVTVHKEVAAITVRDLSGGLVCSSIQDAAASLPTSQMPLITEAVRSNSLYISNAEFGPSSGRWVVGLTLPIASDDSKIKAVLFLTLDLIDYSRRILTALPEGTRVTVLDRNRRVAMRSSDLERWLGNENGDDSTRALVTQREGLIRGRDSGGAYVGAYVTEPLSQWVIVSLIPEDIVLAPQKAQQLALVVAGVLVSLLFLGALIRTASGIARPLQSLAKAAGEVAHGNTNARAPEIGTQEVTDVARQFNAMLDVMGQQREQMRASSEKTRALAEQLMRLEEIGVAGGFRRNLETGDFTLTPGSCLILDLDPSDATGIQDYLQSGRFMTPSFANALKVTEQDKTPWSLDVLVETAKGRRIWLFTRGEADTSDGKVVGVVGHIRDITERKEALTDIATLAAIVEGTEDAIVGKSLKGIVTSWNAAAAELFGYTSEEMIGQPIRRIIPPELYDEENVFLAALARGQSIKHYETKRLARDGRRIDVSVTISPIRDAEGAIIGASKIARDITERKQIDFRLRSIIDASPVPFMIGDGQRNVLFINQAFTRILGYDLDDIRTLPLWSTKLFRDPGDFAEFERGRSERLSHMQPGGPASAMEMNIVTKDGKMRRMIVAMGKLPQSSFGEGVVSLLDVTDLKATQDRLREAQKMEAFGRLASGVAHDFNNLLGIISSSAEILRDQDARQQETDRSTGLILRACERGADLIRRLLIFSRKSKSRPVGLSVTQMMDDLVTILRRTLGSRFSVDVATNCGECHIFADATLLPTALFNLAIIARDAMPDGGKLTFTIDRARGRIGEQPETDIVSIAVKDSGTGIPPEIIEHVFDPFFTTKEPGKGTGLGLSMVYGFVTEAKGDIRVESRPHEGTTFFLRFPEVPPQRKVAQAAPADAQKKAHAGLRTLLVEDDEDLRDATAIQLRRLGVTVQAVASTGEALSLLDSDKDFDLLLTDFQLSEPTNGGQLAREVESRVPDIAVAVMSGYLSGADAGTLDPRWPLLQKPLSREELERVLRAVQPRAGRRAADVPVQPG